VTSAKICTWPATASHICTNFNLLKRQVDSASLRPESCHSVLARDGNRLPIHSRSSIEKRRRRRLNDRNGERPHVVRQVWRRNPSGCSWPNSEIGVATAVGRFSITQLMLLRRLFQAKTLTAIARISPIIPSTWPATLVLQGFSHTTPRKPSNGDDLRVCLVTAWVSGHRKWKCPLLWTCGHYFATAN
jgi:hypothetical protein